MPKFERMLKKEAKRLHKEILARSEDKFQVFLSENYSTPEKQTKTISKTNFKITPKMVVFTMTAILIIALSIVTPFIIKSFNNNDDIYNGKVYYQENEYMIISSLTELNNELQESSIILDESAVYTRLYYDSKSGDHLYYTMLFSDEDVLESAIFFVTVNEYYIEENAPLVNPISTTVNTFDVKYSATFNFIDDLGLYLGEVNAIILTDMEHINITYEAYSFDESSNFLNWLEKTVIAK